MTGKKKITLYDFYTFYFERDPLGGTAVFKIGRYAESCGKKKTSGRKKVCIFRRGLKRKGILLVP